MDAKSFAAVLKPVQEYTASAPKPLCELIHHCLAYKPQQRPENVGDILPVLHDLSEAMVKTPEDALDNMEW